MIQVKKQARADDSVPQRHHQRCPYGPLREVCLSNYPVETSFQTIVRNAPLTPHRASRADIQFVDYDNVRFHLSTPESKTVLVLSMAIQCWGDLAKYGAREHLQKTYGEYLLEEAQTEPEYNVSLKIDLERIPESPGECGDVGRGGKGRVAI